MIGPCDLAQQVDFVGVEQVFYGKKPVLMEEANLPVGNRKRARRPSP